MAEYKVLKTFNYDEPEKGISVAAGNMVTITGEQKVQLEDGRIIEQYVYDIDGYTAKNGKQFAALKANIMLI